MKRRGSLSNLHEQRPTMDFSEALEFCKCFGIVPDLLDIVELQDLFALVNGDEECVGRRGGMPRAAPTSARAAAACEWILC